MILKVLGCNMIKKYARIYAKIFTFTLQSKMSYRFNFFVELFYGPAYVGVMYLVLRLAFARTTTLGGLTVDEGILLFCVYHLIYLLGILFFFMGFRHFLWQGIRQGQVDFVLTKPVNPQFLISFSHPEVQQLPLVVSIFLLFVHQIFRLPSLPAMNYLHFIILFVIGLVSVYFSVSTYSTLGFFVTRAQQIIEFYDKISDNSQYPTSIYPTWFQAIAVSFIPIAFFGYIPTLFLLGRGSLQLFLLPIIFLIIMIPLNQLAWRFGLRHYSSASS